MSIDPETLKRGRIIVEEYINKYKKQIDYYGKVAVIVYRMMKINIKDNEIRAVVTCRAKEAKSLRNKLFKKNEEMPFASEEDIEKRIDDLSGVRIAVYFPKDIELVESIIHKIFEDLNKKKDINKGKKRKRDTTGYDDRFPGYQANHYVVKLRQAMHNKELIEKVIPKDGSGGADYLEDCIDTKVEIQVGTILMFAWSEVEHDLRYKPLMKKELSWEERATLDELRGLMLTGEIALDALKRSVEISESINTREKLAEIMNAEISKNTRNTGRLPLLGRVELLLKILLRLEYDLSNKKESLFQKIDIEYNCLDLGLDKQDWNISEQIILILIRKKPQILDKCREIYGSDSDDGYDLEFDPEFSEIIDKYLRRWAEFNGLFAEKRNLITAPRSAFLHEVDNKYPLLISDIEICELILFQKYDYFDETTRIKTGISRFEDAIGELVKLKA